ncbi:MAG: DNA circularization N-terminal domain-containing protein [Reyranella sp.]|nr:DNA circularization N-terminal domain-containing protein [Reyranella sp.]
MTIGCSFRGIPFGWEERGGEITPRFVEHDFPQKRGRWHEDMAAGPRVFTIVGYLLGGSTELVRARLRLLMKACGDQRPGTLIHPTFGAVRSVCTGFKHKESISKLNRIDLDMTFVEDEGAQFPIAGRWIGAALGNAIDGARDQIGAGLDQVFNLAGMPSYVTDLASEGLADLAVQVFGTLGLLSAPVRFAVSTRTSLLAGIAVEAGGLSAPLGGLFAAYTTDSADRTIDMTGPEAEATAAVLASLSTFTLPGQPATTFARAVAAQALDGLAATVRRLALLEEANVSRQRRFVSSDQAIAARDDLADRLDVEILAAADQASTDGNDVLARIGDALAAVRAEMVADLTERAASLKPVAHIVLKQARPAIAVAYALYGDGDASAGERQRTLALTEDLAVRNRVRDPGEMPGGVALEYQAA